MNDISADFPGNPQYPQCHQRIELTGHSGRAGLKAALGRLSEHGLIPLAQQNDPVATLLQRSGKHQADPLCAGKMPL
jgi:hypothetical protein